MRIRSKIDENFTRFDGGGIFVRMEPATTNRRTTERQPSFLGGTIIYNRHRWSTPCIVKNLSQTGAKLTAKNLPALPDNFELHVPQKNATYAVHLKWRAGDVIGVEINGIAATVEPVKPARKRQPTDVDLGI